MLTLDAIEKDVIGEFNDARALLALGRGAIGGPRLKSEAFTAPRLDSQLQTMASELVTSRDLVFVDVAERAAVGESAVLLARGDLHEVARRSRAGGLRDAQPARAQRAGADRSAARAERSRSSSARTPFAWCSTTSTGS